MSNINNNKSCLLIRVTFFYGLLWEHENLNALTHDIIHEIFGPATSGIFNHVSKVMRKNRLVRADGKDVYLPGVHKKDRVKRNDYRRQIEYLNLPIALFGGELLKCIFHQSYYKERVY